MRLNHRADDDTKDRAAIIGDTQIQQLVTARPAAINAWVEANVTTLAGVRVAIKLILRVLVILARRELRQ